jgi:hypothetical protein
MKARKSGSARAAQSRGTGDTPFSVQLNSTAANEDNEEIPLPMRSMRKLCSLGFLR